ncbi:hypothetical protein ABZ896_46675 [Streptomyces sp. NPDC047072]|uniref:hypothetical protein n=1 Tax=Streptomyces sp. NPDC047072 TaxID=3154809 RepID=UPI003409B01E
MHIETRLGDRVEHRTKLDGLTRVGHGVATRDRAHLDHGVPARNLTGNGDRTALGNRGSRRVRTGARNHGRFDTRHLDGFRHRTFARHLSNARHLSAVHKDRTRLDRTRLADRAVRLLRPLPGDLGDGHRALDAVLALLRGRPRLAHETGHRRLGRAQRFVGRDNRFGSRGHGADRGLR